MKNRFLTDLEILERVEQRNARLNGSLRRNDTYTTGLIFATCLSVCAVIGISVVGHKVYRSIWPSQVENTCGKCHGLPVKMAEYFKKNGSKNPQEMAYAVLQTSSPRLLAAIAKVETGGNSHIRATGYKQRHDGAFQVNSRHWGKVSTNAVEQALQAEAIIDKLTETMGIKAALNYYGGDKTAKTYANTVLAELERTP